MKRSMFFMFLTILALLVIMCLIAVLIYNSNLRLPMVYEMPR